MINFKFYKDNREFLNEEAEYRNPNKGKWFAKAVTLGEMNLEEIADKVAYATTLTPADAHAAVKAFVQVIKEGVQDSKKVRLDGLGTFRAGISCVGADSLDEFSVNKNITGVHIIFRPAYKRDPGTKKHTVAMLAGARCKEAPKNAVV